MAMSVTYATFDGVLVYENRGGVETEYTSDTLGNLIECHGPDGVSTYTADYWPYGGVRASTGTNPSPWGFVGLLGYYTDALNFLYVRARYYRPNLTRWQTVDPLWPSEGPYQYSQANPVEKSDKMGLWPCGSDCPSSSKCQIGCFLDDFLVTLLGLVLGCAGAGGWLCGVLFYSCYAAFFAACITPITCVAAFALLLLCLAPCDAFAACLAGAVAAAITAYCVCADHCERDNLASASSNTGLPRLVGGEGAGQ